MFSWLILVVCLPGRIWSEDCEPEFVNISENVVSVQEDEAFCLNFKILGDCGQSTTILVKQQEVGGVVCTYRVYGRNCRFQKLNKCTCHGEILSFNHTFRRENSGQWTWMVKGQNGACTKSLVFNVTSRASQELRAMPVLQTEAKSTTLQPPNTAVQPQSNTVQPPSTTVLPPSTTVQPPSTTVQPPSTTVQPPSTDDQPLDTGTESAALKPANTRTHDTMDKDDEKTTPASSMTVVAGINSSIIVLIVCVAIIRSMFRNGKCGKPAQPQIPQQAIQRQPQQQPPQQREVRPGGRTPSNHKPALPEGVITGHLLSPNVYDLINEDLVGMENGRQQSATDTQPSISQGVYGEVYEEARPKPCGPRTGYLHPIPAKEDVFADLTDQRQSPRRPASRPKSVPVPRSNMLYFWRR